MRHLLAFMLGFALSLALLRAAPAASPDEVRDAARARAIEAQQEAVSREEKKPREGVTVVAPKPHTWIMTVRSPGQPLIFLQIYVTRKACDGNRALLGKQLGALGWGRAACIEQVQQ